MEHGAAPGGGSIPGLRHRGAAANFLDNKGFGWLMEVADDDDGDQRPLLYVSVSVKLLAACKLYSYMSVCISLNWYSRTFTSVHILCTCTKEQLLHYTKPWFVAYLILSYLLTDFVNVDAVCVNWLNAYCTYKQTLSTGNRLLPILICEK